MDKPKAISLCCGGGIGQEGIAPHIQTCAAVDDNWRVCCSHICNHPLPVIHGDIGSCKVIKYAQKLVGHVNGVIHSPPCPPFSQAADPIPDDYRATTFLSVLGWVDVLVPEFVIIENVPGIRRSPHLAILLERIRFLGYHPQLWLLNAANYGVPQHRERLFVVAVRDGISPPLMPPPTHGSDAGLESFRNLRDAIGDLTEEQAMALGCAPLSRKRAEIMAKVPPGGNWQDLSGWRRKVVLAACKSRKPHPRVCKRFSWDDTPGAILSGAQVKTLTMPLHPAKNRPLSVLEHLRLMGIRREFSLFGSIRDRYRMVGNGIPTGLMTAVCKAVSDVLKSADSAAPDEEKFSQKFVAKCDEKRHTFI